MTSRSSVPPRHPGVIASTFVGITALIGAVIGAVVGFTLAGLLVGAAVAVLGIAGAYRRGIDLLLGACGAEPANERTQPRLLNLVDGLCLTAGVSAPEVYVIPSDAPNAMVMAVSPRRSALAVTTGLLRNCDRVELEAVVAHLVARLRSGHAIAGTLTTVLIGAPVLWGELAVQRRESPGALSALRAVVGRALMVTGGVLAPLMRGFVPTHLITDADHAACQLTRYPPALIAVLDSVTPDSVASDSVASAVTSGRASVVPGAPVATAHLWFLPAVPEVEFHPPIEERSAVLKEL